ncbi:MAG: PQQ-dependent sugar dehydrogenase [Phycisphaerae bacterium]
MMRRTHIAVLLIALSGGAWGCGDSHPDHDANRPTTQPMAADANAWEAFNADGFLAGSGESLLPQREGGRYFTPVRQPVEERMEKLKLPDGFRIAIWAKDLGRPRMMATGSDGTVYITRPRSDDVIALRDADNDGRADGEPTIVCELDEVHGIYIHEGRTVYLATVGEVFTCKIRGDGSWTKPQRILTGMPTASGHHNRTLAIGPDGKLYITVGSTCNCCWEENLENATMLIADPNGANREIFARGLRNTIGFGWHPKTEQLWGMDHGIDWLGPNTPPEELNHIERGHHYGWPWVYGNRNTIGIEKHEAIGSLKEFAGKTTPPVLGYQAHASPLQMVFYTAEAFPEEYYNDAFVAFHGSWNRSNPVGYEVVRIRFDDAGQPRAFEPFVTGFLQDRPQGTTTFGRPCGLAVTREGDLLIGDDTTGVVYRVWYEG